MIKPFTVVTLTGDRPEVFALCRKYLARQTIKPTQWVVVDDGVVPLDPKHMAIPGVSLFYIRRNKLPTDPAHTLTTNLQAALLVVSTDRLIFMEDDDWYASTYLELINEGFNAGGEIVGQSCTVYYRLKRREWRDNLNSRHASLCATGVCSSLFPLLTLACRSTSPMVDLYVWMHSRCFKQILLPAIPRVHAGMKEVPGRVGQTSGWNAGGPRYNSDPDFRDLRVLMGVEDASVYERMISNG
jgi:hypothetical protein